MSEISELRQQLSRVKAEGAAMVESLQNRLKELEMELEELRQIAEASARVSDHAIHCFQLECLFFFFRKMKF